MSHEKVIPLAEVQTKLAGKWAVGRAGEQTVTQQFSSEQKSDSVGPSTFPGTGARVAIIDPSPIYSYGLRRILEENDFTVLTAGDRLRHPDVILLAPAMLNEVEQESDTPILLIVDDEQPATPGRPDVYGSIRRTAAPEQVVRCVRQAVAGLVFPPSESSDAAELKDPPLSERERQVLERISRGLTHGQIARSLGISPHTVDTYVRRIRAKLSLGNKAELTRAALRIEQRLVGGA